MVALGFKWMWNPASPFYVKPRLNFELLNWGMKFWRAANAEHVRLASPLLRDLHLTSRKCFEELASLTNDAFGLVTKGLLMLCKTQHGLDEEAKAAEQARALGMPAEVLDVKQTAALDPAARMDVVGSIQYPLDCHLTPDRFMAALQEQCANLGVSFVWDAEVSHLAALGKQVAAIKTERGEFDFDELVLCGGSWSPTLARSLGLKIPMQAGKGYSLTLPNPRQLPGICSILTEARVAVTPMGKTLRVGGTMEIAGLNEDISAVRVRGIIDSFCRYFPDFMPADFEGVQPWRGLRPCSPDGLPYVGRMAKFTNLSIATGHAMMGLSLGPATGKLMAEILSGEKPKTDISMLSPDRYG
jgi:D-amino-acid dehydrogenase